MKKLSIEALERAQGYLKLPNGRALTGQSHDDKRHGISTTLFAALDVASGPIIAEHSKRRRRIEFLGFMKLASSPPSGIANLHVILENTNTHKNVALAEEAFEISFHLHSDAIIVAQPGRDLVFGPPRPVTDRGIVDHGRGPAGAHRRIHRYLQRDCDAVRLD